MEERIEGAGGKILVFKIKLSYKTTILIMKEGSQDSQN
ncbi:hypothetical protein E2C01_101230 [Portunus trituberculatus]|uniref:Uncharacterized protein n=1 Tax=Portunus trituberculatus TaxID=210409 RepID=A0A5B7KFA7_PORTR|nr:hypothetical protein [Portunus trituberculatus]